MRVESSIMSSLSELRAIHHQRLEDERTSFERERQAEVEARRAAEDAARSAADARLKEEREAILRIEEARVAAEREARLKLEAAEAAERARHVAELELQRQHQEMELRRAEIAKKRPKWMVAVTAVAVCAGIGLGYLAIQSAREADAASQKRQIAETQKEQAKRDAAESRAQLAIIEKSLDDTSVKLDGLTKALLIAQSDADRKRLSAEIAAERKKEADDRQRIVDWKKHQDDIDRHHGLHNDGCLGTALGCLKNP
jgi:hypothetical protein